MAARGQAQQMEAERQAPQAEGKKQARLRMVTNLPPGHRKQSKTFPRSGNQWSKVHFQLSTWWYSKIPDGAYRNLQIQQFVGWILDIGCLDGKLSAKICAHLHARCFLRITHARGTCAALLSIISLADVLTS
jgi:hypothetical protein